MPWHPRLHGRPAEWNYSGHVSTWLSFIGTSYTVRYSALTYNACNTEEVAAVVQLQRQNVQQICPAACAAAAAWLLFLQSLQPLPLLTYLAAAIACVAAVPFLGLCSPGTDEALGLGWFIHSCKLRRHRAGPLLIACSLASITLITLTG